MTSTQPTFDQHSVSDVEAKLDEDDAAALSDSIRLSHEQVFENIRAQFHGKMTP